MHKTIILIDDDEISLFLHTRMLRNCGLDASLISFNDSIQAFDYINENLNGMHRFIILLDINMPMMNGWQVLAALEELPNKKNLEVFVVSSSIDPADINRAQNIGLVSNVFMKPITMEICNEIKTRL